MERQTSSSMVSTWLTVTSLLLFITEAVSSAHGNVKPKTIPSAQYTWKPAITHGYQTSTIASFANPFDATAVVGSATDKPVTDDRRLKTEPADPCKAAAYLGDIALTEDELDLIGRGLLLPTASTAIPTKSRSAAAARRTSKRRRPKSPSVVTSNDDVNAVTGVNLPSSRDGHRPPARRESRGRSSSTTSEWTSHDSVTREPILRTSTQSTANRQVRGQSSDTTLGWFSPTMSTSSMAEWTTRETEVFGDDLRSERDQNRRTKHVRPAHAPMQRPTATSGDVDHQDHHRKKGRRRTTAQPPDGTFDAIRHANGRRSDKNAPSPGSVKTRTTTIGTEQQHHRQRRAATARPERLWDHGVIPYEIEANFSGAHKALFKQAMRHWENYTCISFVERTQDDPNYILFTERPCGCCSFVGKRGNGPQAISIGKNCDKFGIVVHELGHVVGFWHEHTRPDRDDHVQIVFKNIMPGQEYNFNTLTSAEVNSLNESYDFASIMHYARNTFAKATYLDTIMPRRDPSTSSRPEIGQRINLSQGDITQANKLYRCPRCGRTLQDSSGSFGYPWPSSPEAQSPAGSTGSDVVHPWAHTTVGDAARVSVMAAGMAPDQVPAACQWRISGTHGEKIVINVTALSLAASDCATDYLEIRDGHWYKSPLIVRYCTASTQQIKFPVTVTSSDSRVWIEYRSSSSLSSNRLGPSVFQAKYEAVCGGEIVKESGILSSPNYPDIYKPNKECVWKVTVPEGYSVALKFQSFEIESHENCVYDYVELRDGHEDGARVIGKYCGNKMPGDVKSTGNKLYIKFVSDASVQKPGFAATFMKEFDECLTDTHGCHHQCVNTLGSFQCKCNIGYELHSDGRRCEDACGGYINAANGTIQSPSFPELYPQNKNCVWQIVAPDQYRITINFTHFDLEGNNQDCDYDKVELRSGFETDDKVHGTYCGSTVPQPMTSEGSRLRVTFVTDNSVQKSGFSAVFFTDKDECAVDNGGCQHVCKNTVGSYKCSCHTGYILHDDGHGCKEGGCQHEISKPVGELLSPNWPDYYPSRKDCTWHLSTTAGHRIKLTFNEFEVEPHEECTYDRLEVYDGDDSNAPRLNRMCGSGLPAPLLSSANRMFLTFYSDASVQKKGFHITHTTVCGGDLVATSKASYLYSHAKHGDHNYDNKENCEWRIVANDTSHRIRFRFLTFEVEDEPDCGYDVVEIYDISTRSPQLLKKYCSHEIPPDVISLGNQLLVRFKTDDTITYKGFSAAFVLAGPDTLPPAPSRSSNGNGGSSISSSVRGSGGSLTAGTLSAKNAAVSPGGRGSGSSYAGIGTRSVVSPVMTGLVETRSKLKPGTTTMTSSSDTHGSNSGGSSGGVHNQRVHRGDGLTPRRSQGHSRHRDGSGTRSKRQRVTSGSSSSSAA